MCKTCSSRGKEKSPLHSEMCRKVPQHWELEKGSTKLGTSILGSTIEGPCGFENQQLGFHRVNALWLWEPVSWVCPVTLGIGILDSTD